MGNNQNKTLIIWIDKDINNKENEKYQEILEKYDKIKLKCYEQLDKGIELIKETKFQKTIIITSGRIFPDFYKEFKANLKEINIIPHIIIFTSNIKKYKERNEKSLLIKEPFYNNGGIVDSIEKLQEIVEKVMNNNDSDFDRIDEDRFQDEKFKYEFINNKNELKLPMFYPDFLKKSTEEDINKLNKKIFEDNKNIKPLGFLLSQLAEIENIPLCLLSKYWIRAYSIHSSFTNNMNENLLEKKYEDYLPIIQKLYEAVNLSIINSEFSQLYKGIIVDKDVWKSLLDDFKEKENDIPKAILYGPSFFSFYVKENFYEKFKDKFEKNKKPNQVFIKLILEKPENIRFVKNNAIIGEEISYFEDNNEILFFPFSCFEIKKVKRNNDKEYTIILNYLDNYVELFTQEESKTLKEVVKNDFSELLFNSGIINTKAYEMPNWIGNKNVIITSQQNIQPNSINPINLNNLSELINQYSCTNSNNLTENYTGLLMKGYLDSPGEYIKQNAKQQNFIILKSIDDKNFQDEIGILCLAIINQGINLIKKEEDSFIKLRNTIQDIISEKYGGNWWINVGKDQLNNFGNINKDSVMIFQYDDEVNNFYIHIAKISSN